MKCELAQQHIAFFAYGELPDDQCHQLEQHLTACPRCQDELEAVRALQQAMSLAPVEDCSPNLLALARLRLEESLDHLPRLRWLERAQRSILGSLGTLSRAPVAASALLFLGIGLGSLFGFRAAQRTHPDQLLVPPSATIDNAPAQIANVSSIIQEPNTENVEVRFNRLVPQTIHGSLDDPQIRQLLLLGAQSPIDPGVQQNSLSLLADECRAGHQCSDGPMRQSLMVALLYDKSAKVRLKALDGLESYVSEDMRVRDAVLEALMNDRDADIRARAIELLEPVQADSSVQEVLHTVASQDDNPHIRTVSREVLDQTPQIQ